MRPDERLALRRTFHFRCGYCGVSEHDVGAELTIDHFQPQSRGGLHAPANWVYCCHACNEFKGDAWQPDSSNRILHPLQDDLAANILENEDGTLQSLSDTGANHIERLHLNRRPLVKYRWKRRQMKITRQAQTKLLERVEELEGKVQSMTSQLEQLKGGDLP